MLLAESPFAPDAASEWWSVGINAAISVATVWALVLTMQTNRRSIAREDERDRLDNQEALERRAARQAASVRLAMKRDHWGLGPAAQYVFTPSVVNASDSMIFSAIVEWVERGADGRWTVRRGIDGLMARQHIGRVSAEDSGEFGPIFRTRSPKDKDSELDLRLTFTDAYGDTWQRDPDRVLTLLETLQIRTASSTASAPTPPGTAEEPKGSTE